jgi:hypothetical protein
MASPTQIATSSLAANRQPGMMRFFGFLTAAGLLNALIAAFLLFRLPDAHHPTITSLCIRASIFVVSVVLAGSAGIWFYWRNSGSSFTTDPPLPITLFVLCCGIGWVWVPAFVLLSREDSPLTGPIAVLAAALLGTALRTTIPPSTLLYPDADSAPPDDNELFAATLRRPRREAYGYIVALCIYLAGYYYANGWIIDGSSILGISAFIFAWKLTLESRHPQCRQPLRHHQRPIRPPRRRGYSKKPANLISSCTSSDPAPSAPGEIVLVCGARQWSIWLIRCTHPMVQFGAQLLAVKNSRFTSAVVYSAIGTPG